MRISARNQIAGEIVSVERGAVSGIVAVNYGPGEITATISLTAIQELGLKEKDQVMAVIKATDVMIGRGEMSISARNQLPGEITSIERGAVNGMVALTLHQGPIIYATISLASIANLGLEVGMEATAVIKATSVMIAK